MEAAKSALAELQRALSRDDIAEIQRVHKLSNMNAWVAGSRYDCIIAATSGDVKAWDAVAKRAEALLLNPKARDFWKSRPDCYIAATLDQARATL